MTSTRLIYALFFGLMGVLTGCAATPGAPSAHGRAAHGESGPPPGAQPWSTVRVVDMRRLPGIEDLIPRLLESKVVFVGETHNNFGHHQNQLALIRALYERDPDLAIGMEMFQQPFQSHLDDYIAGRIDETALLRRTEYFQRWGYDFRLYAPVLRFARDNDIPVIALNAPAEVTRAVSQKGIGGLDAATRARLPATLDRSENAYRQRLRRAFAQHPQNGGGFERFFEVQLVWDETMAARVAESLRVDPDRRLVVLAGSGHVAYGSGIPQRVRRRVTGPMAIVVHQEDGPLHRGIADFVLLSPDRALPPAGRLGVKLEAGKSGLRVTELAPGGAARDAGVRVGDWIQAVDGETVSKAGDVRALLWNARPGQRVSVALRRERAFAAPREWVAEIALQP